MTPRTAPVLGFFAHIGKAGVVEHVLALLRRLKKRGVPFLVETDLAALLPVTVIGAGEASCARSRDDIGRDADIVITFGGDGTMLAAAHAVQRYDTPILGVNLGKLGFLADIAIDDVLPAVERILDGAYRVEKRMTLTAIDLERKARYRALNDIVVSKGGTARVLRIETFVNGDFLATFLADGVIIATPTGSTAYSLATGGPIVVPSSNVMILSPISAHALTARPIILPADSEIALQATAEDGAVMVMADGHYFRENDTSASLTVRRGSKPVNLVKDIGPNYFETLRTKLSWAQDRRFSNGQLEKE
ncbi:MAG: NAD(+)/NADH kinase [Ignavibacteria bacterium]|nr:NAD(+)/NADH kinase [Ignavibacteria bacterium]